MRWVMRRWKFYYERFSNTQLWLTFKVSLVCNRKQHIIQRYSKLHTIKCSHVVSHFRYFDSKSNWNRITLQVIYCVLCCNLRRGLIQFHWNPIPIIGTINISNSQQIHNWFFIWQQLYFDILITLCDRYTQAILSHRSQCTWIHARTHTLMHSEYALRQCQSEVWNMQICCALPVKILLELKTNEGIPIIRKLDCHSKYFNCGKVEDNNKKFSAL